MKKYLICVTAILLICALTLGIAACDDNADEPIVVPELTPGEAFAEALEKITSSKNINPGNDLNIAMEGYVYFKQGGKRLSFSTEINNVEGELKDMYLEVEADDKKLTGIYVDGKDCYVDLGEFGYKYENVQGGGSEGGSEGGARDGRLTADVSAIAELIGGMVFKNVSMKGGDYIFEMNLGEIAGGTLGGLIESMGVNFDDIGVFLGYDGREHMLEELKKVSAFVELDFNKDRFVGAHFSVNGGLSVDMGVSNINISDAVSNVDYSEMIPDKEYLVTNAINFRMYGEFALKGTENGGEGRIAKYDWRLLADIDPFNPNEKDRFHLVVTNKTSDNSDEYNAEKITAKDGVILEIAYAPKEFGTDNILVAVNLKAILDKSILDDMGVNGSVGKLLPDYYGAFVDIDAINALSSVGKVGARNGGNMNTLANLLGKIKFSEGGISIDRSLLSVFGGNEIIDTLLDTSADKTEALELKVDFMTYGGKHDNYDVKNHYFNVADLEGAKKSFGLLFNPALSAEAIGENGFAAITTADGKKINDGVNRISPQELHTLIGGTVNYSFLGYNGKTANAAKPVVIMGISGVDTSLIGEEQEITLVTSEADGENLSKMLAAAGVKLNLPINAFKTKIILSEESESAFTDNLGIGEYRVGDEISLSDDDVTLDITYGDGSNYRYKANGFYHDAPLTDGRIAAAGNYSVVYRIGGREYVRNIVVTAPDAIKADVIYDAGKVGGELPASFGKLVLTYGEESREFDINRSMISFPRGAVKDGKFAYDGDYFVKIRAFGYSGTHRINVSGE